jgi:broad specificity phosphatase PhoE
MVQGASDIAEDFARAEMINQQIQIEKEHSYLENALLQEQVRHEQRLHNLDEDERLARREEIVKAEAEHIRRQLAEQGSPFDRIVREARARAADSAAEILQSIKKNGFVRGKVAKKGSGLREYFALMATHEDKYLMDMLRALENQIGPVGDRPKEAPDRDLEKITATLESIVNLADSEFQVITSGPGRFSAVEL